MKASGMLFGETITGASDLPVRGSLIRLRQMMPLDRQTVNNLDPVKTGKLRLGLLGSRRSFENLSNSQ
jgi:hypothetical protein